MKNLFFIISILVCPALFGQHGTSFRKSPVENPGPFRENRERVWEVLSNLPIDRSDWRYEDLQKNFLPRWHREIFGTAIFYVDNINEPIETPSMYYAPSPEGYPSRIELDSSMFTITDDETHCVEHELGHAAFGGMSNVPGWLLYLGDITSKQSGSEFAMAHERIVMALVLRRDILDHYGLSLNAKITESQFDEYVADMNGRMDHGLKWLLETTQRDRLIPLINFENGYLVNEKLVT